ncbi:hypothetical protein GCM10025734_23900 [Kitasatospora paranensis]
MASTTSSTAAETHIDVQACRVPRPRGAPSTTRAGHTFTMAPIPASAPPTRGRLGISSRAAIASAVTGRSYRPNGMPRSSGIDSAHIQAPAVERPRCTPPLRRSDTRTRAAWVMASVTSIRTAKACR